MCCRSEWQERMYNYKWHEVDQTKHEIFCVHIVCNEIQVKVNLEITTFFFYLRFPYCPNFFWFGVVYTWMHFLARHEIRTNNYILLQFHFPKETNSDTFYSFSYKFTEFWLIKRIFRTITLKISCYDFKTILICWEIWKLMLLNVSIAHIQPRIYGFS